MQSKDLKKFTPVQIMSLEAGSVAQSQSSKPDQIVRHTANFHPSILGDQFMNYDSEDFVIYIMQLNK